MSAHRKKSNVYCLLKWGVRPTFVAVEGDIHESGCDTDNSVATFLHCRVTVAMEKLQRTWWYWILWSVHVSVCDSAA